MVIVVRLGEPSQLCQLHWKRAVGVPPAERRHLSQARKVAGKHRDQGDDGTCEATAHLEFETSALAACHQMST